MNILFIFIITLAVIFVLSGVITYFTYRRFTALKKNTELNQERNRQALDETQEAARIQRIFLNKMSHEILAPMNTIINMSEQSLRDKNPETIREHTITINQAAGALLSLFTDLLDFSQIKSNSLDIKDEEYYFSALINDVVNIIKMRALYSRLRFLVNVDKNIPQTLIGDITHIRQILLLLLSNALKFTDRGYGYISLTVMVEKADKDTVYLTIEVTDSGHGMKEEKLAHLFDEPQDEGGNSNLRMSHVRKLLRAMGGDIRVTSQYGEGTTFSIFLPQKVNRSEILTEVENAANIRVLVYERREQCAMSIICTLVNLGVDHKLVNSSVDFVEQLKSNEFAFVFVSAFLYDQVLKKHPPLQSDAKIVLIEEFGDKISEHDLSVLSTPIYTVNVANILNGERHNDIKRFTAPDARVLVVDDIYANLQVTTGFLLPYGMRIDLCLKGEDAIAHIKRNRYDIVFMDQMMPGMSGMETTAHIRNMGGHDSYFKQVPIIALTANAASNMRELLLMKGMNDYLAKPIDTVKLNDILKNWLPMGMQIESPMEAKAPPAYPVSTPENKKDITIPELDIQHGIAMTGGTLERYLNTLAMFVSDASEKIIQMKNCIDIGDTAVYTIHVHALKSVLASIGSPDLSDMAKELENAGNHGDTEYINEQHLHFIDGLQHLISKINNILPQPERVPDNSYEIKELLIRLRAALEEMDFDNIQEYTVQLQSHTTVTPILKAVLVSDYEEAIALINNML